VDGGRPELAEVTGVVQLLADGQHEVLQVTLGAVNRRGQAAGSVCPVHPIQAPVAGSCHPALHGGQGDAEAVGDVAQGSAGTDGCDHLAAALGGIGFLHMAVSSSAFLAMLSEQYPLTG
jgi:hypothetical protein